MSLKLFGFLLGMESEGKVTSLEITPVRIREEYKIRHMYQVTERM